MEEEIDFRSLTKIVLSVSHEEKWVPNVQETWIAELS